MSLFSHNAPTNPFKQSQVKGCCRIKAKRKPNVMMSSGCDFMQQILQAGYIIFCHDNHVLFITKLRWPQNAKIFTRN